ncbi:hypothetical protein PIB30_054336 [Stylosanthes scabra]|uniref:Uncharacterized protein n=1 Tax=Stylosanthes scabra TaxID=79078 RepID=A0ABU6VGZ0_9FABA|nr:hypothetical protein [Stylosanthes scabra]
MDFAPNTEESIHSQNSGTTRGITWVTLLAMEGVTQLCLQSNTAMCVLVKKKEGKKEKEQERRGRRGSGKKGENGQILQDTTMVVDQINSNKGRISLSRWQKEKKKKNKKYI